MFKDNLRYVAASNALEDSVTIAREQSIVTELLCENALLRAGLVHLLSGTCFTVIDNVTSLSQRPAHPVPSLYVVDATGAIEQALEFTQKAKQQYPGSRVVVVTNLLDRHLVQLALSAGVDSFCLATAAREVLITTLELTMLGEKIIPGALIRSLFNEERMPAGFTQVASLQEQPNPDPRAKKLSPRETVILQSLMGGDPNKVIARKLDITEATIKVHVKAILRKIGVANRTQAAMWATGNLRETAPSAGESQEVPRLS